MVYYFEWLEPYVEKEVDVVVELCEEETNAYYVEINDLLTKLHNGTQESLMIISSIENLVLMKTRKAVESSFKYALYKGIEIGKSMIGGMSEMPPILPPKRPQNNDTA